MYGSSFQDARFEMRIDGETLGQWKAQAAEARTSVAQLLKARVREAADLRTRYAALLEEAQQLRTAQVLGASLPAYGYTVKLCDECKGEGQVKDRWSQDDSRKYPCQKCGASGAVAVKLSDVKAEAPAVEAPKAKGKAKGKGKPRGWAKAQAHALKVATSGKGKRKASGKGKGARRG